MGNFTGKYVEAESRNKKESHLSVLCNFKQKEDVKLYGQLPDYDDFQGYDLGKGDI